MQKDYVKESEEYYYLNELVKHFNKQEDIASVFQYPILKSIQKELKNSGSISDALIDHNGKRRWVEIVTMSRSKNERSIIGKERKGDLSTVGIVRTMNLNVAHNETFSSLLSAISVKCAKNYSEFAELTQSSNGILLVGFMNSDPFFTRHELAQLIEKIDEHTMDSLLCGKSNFSEIYFSCCVDMLNGEWQNIVVCIANADMMNRARDRYIRKQILLEEFEKRKELQDNL